MPTATKTCPEKTYNNPGRERGVVVVGKGRNSADHMVLQEDRAHGDFRKRHTTHCGSSQKDMKLVFYPLVEVGKWQKRI